MDILNLIDTINGYSKEIRLLLAHAEMAAIKVNRIILVLAPWISFALNVPKKIMDFNNLE